MPHALRTVAIDGLRGVALLCVLASHAGAPLFGGHVLMFVLSGYLVTTMLLKEQATTHTIRTHAFYAHRARRLLPALIAMLIGVNALAVFVMPDALNALHRDSLYALAGLSNWAQMWHSPSTLLLHLWTLAIQVQVSVLWPVGLLLFRHAPRGVLLWMCIGGAGIVCAIRAHLVLSGASLGVVYVSTYTRIDGVLLGSALAVALSMPCAKRWIAWCVHQRALMSMVALSALVILVVCLTCYPMRAPMTYVLSMPLVSLCTVVLMALFTLPQTTWLARVFEHRALVWLGTISYGAYLWHWPIVILLKQAGTPYAGLIGAACGLLMGVLSYALIEAPMRGRR